MMKKWILIFFVFGSLSCNSFLYAEGMGKIKEGTYSLIGKSDETSSKTYKGQVIIFKEKNIYFLTWKIEPWQKQLGVGLLTNDVFSVAYVNDDLRNPYAGVVSYKILSENEMEGKWTSFAGANLGSEKLVWVSDKIE